MDPGTALAVVSLVLQVASGLHEYFKLWKDCDEDVATLGASLTRITKIFEHLASLLRAPVLDSALVSTICGNVKECEEKIKELEQILKRFKKEGTPASTYEKLKLKSRRALYPFRASTILSISELVEDMKDDLSIALQLLSIDTNVSSSVKLDTIENHVLTFGSKIDAVSRDLETIGAQIHSVDSNVLSMDPKLDGLKSQLELEFKDSQRYRILNWLDPPDVSTAHGLAIEKRHPETGKWFLDGSDFMTWKHQSGSRLWLYGNSGCGKTILSSAIIEHLREHLQPLDQQQGRPNLAYFSTSHSMTHSISRRSLGNSSARNIPAKPSTPALKAALRSILRSDSGDTSHLQIQSPGPHETRESYFVFDGLDEIPHGELREEILGLLSDLSTTFGSNKIHILVTSRPDKDISEYLPGSQGWLRLSMGRCKIEDDIALYVSGQISSHAKLSRLPLDVKNRIKHELVQGAKWNILSRIDPMYRREALTALEWLVFARRPLFLEEVAEASIIDRSSKKIIDPNRQLDPSDIADMLVGRVFWTTEEPMWDRTWLKSAMFLDSPYNNPSISSFLQVLSYYPLYHCVVHGLDMIVRYILDKSSPLLSFGDFPSTLETAVLLDNFDIVELLLRKGASFGNSLRLAFRQRNNAVAIELIRQGCDVKASDLVLATPWCSPKTILHLFECQEELRPGQLCSGVERLVGWPERSDEASSRSPVISTYTWK
ncbi:unnamed protein product [Alternaria alternata]